MDPYYSDVVSLVHLNGTNGSTSFPDVIATNTWTAVGSIAISTTQQKWRLGAMYSGHVNQNNCITNASTVSNAVAALNFTVEGWFYPSAIVASNAESALFAFGAGPKIGLFIAPSNVLRLYYAGGSIEGLNLSLLPFQWNHFFVQRCTIQTVANVISYGLNGVINTQIGIIDGENLSGNKFLIGNNNGETESFNGYMNDFRITAGVGRYSANMGATGTYTYDVPTAPFPGP